MNTHRIPLLLASLLLAACSNVVITDGGNGDGNIDIGGTGGIGVGGSAGTGAVQPTIPAIALTRAQQRVLWDQWDSTHVQTGSSGGTGGGTTLDPNDLFLRVSDQGVSCGVATTDLFCGGNWELSLLLPSALQQVGVYDLGIPELESGILKTEAPYANDPNDCGWSGGPYRDGTLEILSIDATAVHFRVTITSEGLWKIDASGDYTAPRCP